MFKAWVYQVVDLVRATGIHPLSKGHLHGFSIREGDDHSLSETRYFLMLGLETVWVIKKKFDRPKWFRLKY